MNYDKQYNNLINSRLSLQRERVKQKKCGIYFETHHIIPRCIGGTDVNENLILLTGKEHYIAHLLLWKIHGGVLFYAVWRMVHPTTTSGVGAKVTARRFEFLREHQRENNRRYGEQHWNYGKHHSKEAKQKMSERKIGKPSPRKGVKLTEETKQKIREYNLGKKLSPNHKKKIAQGMKNSNHPMVHYEQPFQHIKICNNKTLMLNWLAADKIYLVWINKGKPGSVKLSRLTNIKITQLCKMVKWFIEYGDPSTNELWINWKKEKTNCQEKERCFVE